MASSLQPMLLKSTDWKKAFMEEGSSDEEPESPASAVSRIIEKIDLGDMVSPRNRELLVSQVEAYQKRYTDLSVRKQKAKITLQLIAKKFGSNPSRVGFHRKGFEMVEVNEWALKVLSTLREMAGREASYQIMPRIINIPHIFEGELALNKSGLVKGVFGFHFCPPSHPARASILHLRRNPLNGVMAGKVSSAALKGRRKCSTLFPDSLRDENAVIRTILAGQCIARSRNAILLSGGANQNFCVELLLRGEEAITSAYPIFEYRRYQPDGMIPIDQWSATGWVNTAGIPMNAIASRISSYGQSIRLKYEYVDESTEGRPKRRIYDIAPLFPEPHIKEGIYVDTDTDFATGPAPAVVIPSVANVVAVQNLPVALDGPTGSSLPASYVHTQLEHLGLPQRMLDLSQGPSGPDWPVVVSWNGQNGPANYEAMDASSTVLLRSMKQGSEGKSGLSL